VVCLLALFNFEVAAYMGCASDLSALFREMGVDFGKRLPGSPLFVRYTDPVELDRLDVPWNLWKEFMRWPLQIESSSKSVENAVPDTDEMKHFRDRLVDLDIELAFDRFRRWTEPA